MNSNTELVCQLAGLEEFTAAEGIEKPTNAAATIVEQMQIYLHDAIDHVAERRRLEKQKEQLDKARNALEAKLANKNFITRAKPEVVANAREKLTELSEQLVNVEKHLGELTGEK